MDCAEGKPESGMTDFFWAIFLTVLGLLGNYITLSLGFNVSFIFGSIFGLLAVALFGLRLGVPASLVATTYTYVLWNHPYAIVIFTCESLWVGLTLRRWPAATLVLLDLAYWVCLGIPLVFLFYFGVMDLGMKSAAFIALKQSLNGVCNAIVASFLLNTLPFRRWLGLPAMHLRANSQVFFEAMALLLMVPSIGGLIFMNQRDITRTEESIAVEILQSADEGSFLISNWLEQLKRGTRHLAQKGEESRFISSEQLQGETSKIRELFPDFHSIYVANASATTIAFDPLVNEHGETTIGMNFADREYYQTLLTTGKDVVSDVFIGRGGTFKPIFTVSTPVVRGGRMIGFGLGAVNLEKIAQTLNKLAGKDSISLTIVDQKLRVVTSTDREKQPLSTLSMNLDDTQPVHGGAVFLSLPESKKNISLIQVWKDAILFTRRPIASTTWTLIAGMPLSPLQQGIYESSIFNLIAIFLLLLATNGLSLLVSRLLGEPTKQLAELSSSIPEKLETGVAIDWPTPEILEVAALTGNFRQTAEVLREKLVALKQAKEGLESKVAERTAELQTSNEKFRIIFENEIYGICIFELDNLRIIDCNEAFLRIYGYSREEVLSGLTMADTTAEHDRTMESAQKAIESGTLFVPLRYHRKRDGTIFPVEIVGGGYSWNGKKVLFGLIHDISERVEAERKLHQQTLQLKDISENLELRVREEIERRFKSEQLLVQQSKMAAMGEMLGAIAHQWRQPLNALGIIIQNIRDAYAFGEFDQTFMERSVERSMAQIKHMSKTIDDFRDFFRPDKDKCEFNAIVATAEVIKLFSAQMEASGITFQLNCLTHQKSFRDYDQVIPCPAKFIRGFRNEFEQVIMNLLNNAREAIIDARSRNALTMPGEILFDFSSEEEHVIINVSDNGGGIPEEILARVFDPYFTTKTAKGTGLGLYMSKVIIEDHMGGTLSVANGPSGARFTIRLRGMGGHQE